MHHPRRVGGGRRERQPVWSNYALCRLGTRTACGDARGRDSPARLCRFRFRAAPALLAFAAEAGAFAALGGQHAGVAGVDITLAQVVLQLAGQRGVIPADPPDQSAAAPAPAQPSHPPTTPPALQTRVRAYHRGMSAPGERMWPAH